MLQDSTRPKYTAGISEIATRESLRKSQLGHDNRDQGEHFRCEGAMETVRHVVLQFDASQRAAPKVLCVQQTELGDVLLRHVQLHDDVAIILVPSSARAVAEPGDEHGLSDAAARIPHLPLLAARVKLCGEDIRGRI